MAIRIVRLGSDRLAHEGLRIGAVRRPPRGVLKSEYAAKNYYDVWLPILAPSADLVKLALAAVSAKDWNRFAAKYRRQMGETDERGLIDMLAGLSQTADFSLGCYCAIEERCHRSILKQLLIERRAKLL